MKHYKIVKLKSGEDIIGTVRLSKDGTIKVYRPMIFKSMVTQDLFGGMREVFMLKDWLMLSDSKVAVLSKDSINTIVPASIETSKLYETEKHKLDIKPNKPKKEAGLPFPFPPMPEGISDEDLLNDFKKHVEDMIDSSMKNDEMDSNLKDLAKPQKGDKMVFMNLVFSPEVIVQLLKSGLLDRKELGEMINEITNENGEGMSPDKYTGNDKDKKDLGNSWTDWPSDPNSEDYK
jgi:hypothetical protein